MQLEVNYIDPRRLSASDITFSPEESPLSFTFSLLGVSSEVGSDDSDTLGPKTPSPRSIYEGLLTLEKRCIELNDKHNPGPGENPTRENTLSADHSRLLVETHTRSIHEHRLLYLACRSPSADSAVKDLAAGLLESERMWKHGIEGCLDVLRIGLPASEGAIESFVNTVMAKLSILVTNVPTLEQSFSKYNGIISKTSRASEDFADCIN